MKIHVKQTTSRPNVFSIKTKSNSRPDPATGKKTSLLILLEAVGVHVQKIPNPVHAHLWRTPLAKVIGVTFFDSCS